MRDLSSASTGRKPDVKAEKCICKLNELSENCGIELWIEKGVKTLQTESS